MDKFPKAKVQFVAAMLLVKYSKNGVRRLLKRLAEEHLSKVSFDKSLDRVLHVGCATGDETFWIGERAKSVVGVSLEQDALAIAIREFSADNVEYLLEDMSDSSENVATWRGAFDKVIISILLVRYPDPPVVVRNAITCLKPGGEILSVLPSTDYGYFEGGAKLIREHPEWGQKVKRKESNLQFWTKNEAETLSFFKEVTEWEALSCETSFFERPMTSEEAKKIWLDNLEHVDTVDATHQAECLEALWQWAQSEYGGCNKDGVLMKPAEFLIVHGVRKDGGGHGGALTDVGQ